MRYLLLLLVLTGCVTPSYHAANCVRYRHVKYNVLACDDVAVGKKCAEICETDDQGHKVNYYPRACLDTRPERWSRKPTVLIGRSFMGCLDHEVCHVENPNNPLMCEDKYPCVQDVK